MTYDYNPYVKVQQFLDRSVKDDDLFDTMMSVSVMSISCCVFCSSSLVEGLRPTLRSQTHGGGFETPAKVRMRLKVSA